MGPINYTSPFAQQGSPFSNFAQGLNVGAVMEQGQQRRDAIAQAQQAAEQQAAQQAAAQAELQALQQTPLAQMTQAQRLRLAQLSGSETTRGYLFREIEKIPVEVRQARARSYGSLVTALASNPEIGRSRITTMIEAEKDPQEKQALQLIAKAAEIDPMEAARSLHTMMSMGGEETSKIADSVMTFFENTGRPLYPQAPVKMQVVGGAMFNPRTQQFLQPPQKSDTLSPEAEAQKIRIAAAGRAPRSGGGGGSGGGSGGAAAATPDISSMTDDQLLKIVGKGVVEVVDPADGQKKIVSRVQAARMGAMSAKESNIDQTRTTATGKVSEGRQMVSSVIENLRSNYDKLDRLRAIPSEDRGPVSNVLTSIEASAPGQMASRAVTTRAQTARDVISSSRIQLLNSIKQATGMSAQQLNSNVELQTWLNAVTDPRQSKQTADQILTNIQNWVARNAAPMGGSAAPPPAPGARPPAAAPAAPGRDIGGGFRVVD